MAGRLLLAAVLTAGFFVPAAAHHRGPPGTVFYPASSVRKSTPQHTIGQAQAYTNVVVFVPDVEVAPPVPPEPMATPYFIETPASIACVYALVPQTGGCNPNVVNTNASGGAGVIAIVDAYDAPSVGEDLAEFSRHFGLPPAAFEVVYASGSRPPNAKGWEIEISLDVEWAHAMAPGARIILVEAASNSYEDMMQAVEVAADRVAEAGGGQVSLSWGGPEFVEQIRLDPAFDRQGVVFLAASGDDPGVSYPATSPHVVSVGGTSIVRDASGAFAGEVPWENAGAGPSAIEPKPSFQAELPGEFRVTVDVAAVADPQTGGVWVFDSGNAESSPAKDGWLPVGGTSASTPIVAGIMNNAEGREPTSRDELEYIYENRESFRDITQGTCGPSGDSAAGKGWDTCTGVGVPNGFDGL